MRSIWRTGAACAAALAILSIEAPAQPAAAQGLFEALFGGFHQRRAMPHRMSSFANPYDDRRERRAPSAERRASEYRGGPSSGFCVRTCDGRYFPVRSNGGMTATELCRSFCPAAKTQVFSGSKIGHSVASDGTRYADLDNAFLYRERMVPDCTCNGKDPYGLATLNPDTDPTLRPGDIVATNDGLVTFNRDRRSGSAEFTPIEQSVTSNDLRNRLMSIRVTPAPPRTEVPAIRAEDAQREDRRRVQR